MKHLETNWSRPVAKVEITVADIETLRRCSETHYDSVCRNASESGPGAFLNAWSTKMYEPPGDHWVGAVTVEEEFRVFDTCCKILEMAPHASETPAEATFRHDLRGRFSHVLHEMNNFVTTQRATCSGVVPRKHGTLAGFEYEMPPEEPADYKALYLDLIMQVARKFDGETRHATAKRFIQEAEGAPKALRVARNNEGIWLHVDGGSKKASIPLNFRFDGIVHQALTALVESDIARDAPASAQP